MDLACLPGVCIFVIIEEKKKKASCVSSPLVLFHLLISSALDSLVVAV